MKIALYIEDGLEQIVLTPESDTEKAILGKIHDGSRELSIKRGEFYECRGGWVRHGRGTGDDSTMIVLRPAPKGPTAGVKVGDRVDFMGMGHIVTSAGEPQPIPDFPEVDQ